MEAFGSHGGGVEELCFSGDGEGSAALTSLLFCCY